MLPQTLTRSDMKRIFVELGGHENANVRTTNLPRIFPSLGYKPLWGRKKDIFGHPITRKGDKHPNIINGYVAWETVQLANLAHTKKLFPEYKSIHSQVLQDVISARTNYDG
ncbi:MAG: hypothetical protein F6K40_35500 [Okeania sp. SIO3I5]|uniref:hypothetical protein n=1 Tax=Okeania sp. SIO3I5 TaxID=2607805 RepID=UPI0013BC3137|nr:hypothetical protein [Okeania sp. SIO3I5]NEQ41222.1 hypothetical protein [Okeania sp. SIO3I5]